MNVAAQSLHRINFPDKYACKEYIAGSSLNIRRKTRNLVVISMEILSFMPLNPKLLPNNST